MPIGAWLYIWDPDWHTLPHVTVAIGDAFYDHYGAQNNDPPGLASGLIRYKADRATKSDDYRRRGCYIFRMPLDSRSQVDLLRHFSSFHDTKYHLYSNNCAAPLWTWIAANAFRLGPLPGGARRRLRGEAVSAAIDEGMSHPVSMVRAMAEMRLIERGARYSIEYADPDFSAIRPIGKGTGKLDEEKEPSAARVALCALNYRVMKDALEPMAAWWLRKE